MAQSPRRSPGTSAGIPYDLTAVGQAVYLGLENATRENYSLWKTDGTAAGTTRLARKRPAAITPFGQLAAFVSGSRWRELWLTDGTAAGTRKVFDIGPDSGFYPEVDVEMAAVGALLFVNNGHLWTSNGTPAGTAKVNDVVGGWSLTAVGGVLCFIGDDGGGLQIWESDGSGPGTNPVTALGPDADPGHLAAVGGTLYFTADDGIHGRELWSYVP